MFKIIMLSSKLMQKASWNYLLRILNAKILFSSFVFQKVYNEENRKSIRITDFESSSLTNTLIRTNKKISSINFEKGHLKNLSQYREITELENSRLTLTMTD